tara:strand:+ start:408 stop:509 length:102 start_codon:yes stop_codon:yes gene_type:complete
MDLPQLVEEVEVTNIMEDLTQLHLLKVTAVPVL